MASTVVAAREAPTPSADVAAAITRAARDTGVDPVLAFAIAQQESGFDPNVIGDNGHSVGLFQLNDQGEGAGMTVAQRQDPYNNARIALTKVAEVAGQHPDWTPGAIAAAAQRPEDRAGYANSVNGIYYTLLGVVPGIISGITGGSGAVASSGGTTTPVGLFDNGLVGALWDALGLPGSTPHFGPTHDGSSADDPLSVETFKLAARDAIQIALGGVLIWFGVESILVELTGAPVGRRAQRVFGGMKGRPAQVGNVVRPYTPANRHAERQRKEVEARTPADKAAMRARARATKPGTVRRTQDTGARRTTRRRGMEGLTERPGPTGKSTIITREDPF